MGRRRLNENLGKRESTNWRGGRSKMGMWSRGIDAWAENLIWKMSVEALERFLCFSLALSIYITELSSHALYIIITTRICCFAGRKYEKSQCTGDAYRLSLSLNVFLPKVYTCYIIIAPDIYWSKIQNSQCADNVYWLDFYLMSTLHIT